MQGKRGLIMGVANDHSIAWGIAKTLAAQGATLAFTYQGEALGKRVKPLAHRLGSDLILPCDVEDIASVDAVFATLEEQWGALDFLVHAVAFSDKNELKGRYADTTRENFTRTMLISCFSFTEAAKRAAALMPSGGAMVTLTYNGGERAMPNYNVMGVAKAALEASVRYLAVDFGRQQHPRQCDLGGPDPHARRRRHHRRTPDVRFPAAALAAASRRHTRRTRRRRRSICSPTCRPASPAKSTSSIAAITSSPCRIRTRCAKTRPRALNPDCAQTGASHLGFACRRRGLRLCATGESGRRCRSRGQCGRVFGQHRGIELRHVVGGQAVPTPHPFRTMKFRYSRAASATGRPG